MAASLRRLYQVESPLSKSMTSLSQSADVATRFDKAQPVPAKTVGAAGMNAIGGATAMGALQASGALGAATTIGDIGLASGAGEMALTALGGPLGLLAGAGSAAALYYLS